MVVPFALHFAPALVGTTSVKQLTIKDRGLGTLHGTVGEISGPFTIGSGAGAFILGDGQSTAVTINFNPTATGPSPGTLSLTSDDPAHPSVIVELSGLGQ
jgi:Abnormal spindle-like microcephaly-assoc'd, ASPM-SPD-2-Hydin